MRASRVEVAVGVQDIVAKELVHVAVDSVGAGLGDHVDDRAGVSSVFGVEGVGEDTKFFNRVRGRLHGGKVRELIVGVATIDAEVVGASTAAVHGNNAGLIAAVEQIGTGLRLDAGLQRQQLIGVAGIQRQLKYCALIDDRTHLRAGGFDQGRFRGDFDDFLRLADLHGHVEREDLVDFDRDVFAYVLLEPGLLKFDAVVPGRTSTKT